MIRGVGTDIIEVSRIAEVIQRRGQKFLDRLFTEREQAYCSAHNNSTLNYAGRWAAKEAIVKALGTGLKGGITWLDIEITNDELGKPIVTLSPVFKEKYDSPRIHLSISHSETVATAVAIWEE